jgi:hypothetical protein
VRYKYEKLFVTCLEPRYFDLRDPNALRAAVEHLRPIVNEVNKKFVGVVADAGVIRAGDVRLHATAMLTLEEITGLTPSHVWAKFDAEIDRQVAYFERRSAG